MTNYVAELAEAFRAAANPEKARHLMRFLNTDERQYNYGNQFLGLSVPAHALSSGRLEASSRLRVATACLLRPGMKSVWQRCFLLWMRLWHNDGKQWIYQLKICKCSKTICALLFGKNASKAKRGKNATNDKI